MKKLVTVILLVACGETSVPAAPDNTGKEVIEIPCNRQVVTDTAVVVYAEATSPDFLYSVAVCTEGEAPLFEELCESTGAFVDDGSALTVVCGQWGGEIADFVLVEQR